jgi:hypothetical protein
VTHGSEAITVERDRQITKEGWTPEHDDQHEGGELAEAAACYALVSTFPPNLAASGPPEGWPWDPEWWKPASPIRMLEKAGALIAAEIDRRLRAGEKP